MSQQKAQLVSPIDTFTPPGIHVTGAGIVTATSFVGSGGTVTSIADSSNLNVGVITATTLYGNGENLSGIAGAGYVGQTTAAQSGTTTIDLSVGNVIYFTQDTNTTVAFASTEVVQELIFIRTKDDTTDARTITWPASIIWNGGTAPTLIDSSDANDVQIFNITTRDQGVTWYGYEAMKNDPAEPYNALFTWGINDPGTLGLDDIIPRSSPVQLPGTQWSFISGGAGIGAASGAGQNFGGVKSDGTLWTWGSQEYGNLGHNDRISRSLPTQIPGTQWSSIEMGGGSFYGIKTDGTLWVCGFNYGELGQNDQVIRSSPVQIPGTDWSSASGGELFAILTKTDGTLWAGGYNVNGQFGINDVVHRSSPVQIPGSWSSANAAGKGVFGIKTDGTLWSWGYNTHGNMGQNDVIPRSSPTQVGSDTQWSLIAGRSRTASQTGIFGLKTDGTLWSWGHNSRAILGQNDRVNRSSPVQVGSDTQWNNVKSTNYNAIGTKTDGTLWSWGYNGGGMLGLNGAIPRSSPTQVPGTQWNGSIEVAEFASAAFKVI